MRNFVVMLALMFYAFSSFQCHKGLTDGVLGIDEAVNEPCGFVGQSMIEDGSVFFSYPKGVYEAPISIAFINNKFIKSSTFSNVQILSYNIKNPLSIIVKFKWLPGIVQGDSVYSVEFKKIPINYYEYNSPKIGGVNEFAGLHFSMETGNIFSYDSKSNKLIMLDGRVEKVTPIIDTIAINGRKELGLIFSIDKDQYILSYNNMTGGGVLTGVLSLTVNNNFNHLVNIDSK